MTGSDPVTRRPLVTLSATYGAGGSTVGPQVAERLGVPFLDRAIATDVAERLGLSESEPEEPRSALQRLLAYLERVPAPLGSVFVEGVQQGEERRVREETEKVLELAGASGGVILGRGGAVVLRKAPGALHVRLVGARERRVEQAMQLEGIDRPTAQRRLRFNDKARADYVRHLYRVDADDCSLYHLILDGPTLGTQTCVDLIVSACRVRLPERPAISPVGAAG